MKKKTVITIGFIAAIVAFALVVGTQASKPKFDGGAITQTFSQGQPCASVTIALALSDGTDPVAASERLFAALQQVQGMNSATLDVKTSSMEVGFCESSADEATIRQALSPTGLVAEGPAAQAESVK